MCGIIVASYNINENTVIMQACKKSLANNVQFCSPGAARGSSLLLVLHRGRILERRRKEVLELGDSCCSPVGAGGRGGGTGSEAFVGQSWYFAAEAKCCSTCKYISFFHVKVVEGRLATRCVTFECREKEDQEQQVWPLFIGFPHFPSQNEEASMAQLTRICNMYGTRVNECAML